MSKKRQLAIEPSINSGEVYKSLINHVGIGVFRTTPGITGRFLEVNPAMEEITGYSREELLQMNVADLFVHPEERGEIVRQVLAGQIKEPKEVLFKKKDGTVILVRDKKVAVTAADGQAIYFEGFLEDITERRKMEESLRFSDAAFHSIHEGVFATDNDYIITTWNSICEKMFGIKKSDAIGKRIDEVVDLVEQYPGQNQKSIDSLMLNGYCQEERLYRTPSGDLWLDAHVQAIESDSERTGWVTLVADTTERKQAEDALKKSEEKLNLMFQSVTDGIVLIDLKGIITDVNQAIVNMMSLGSREEIIGRSVLDFIAPEYREIVQLDLQRDPQEESLYKKELIILKSDCKNLSIEVSAGFLKDASNQAIGSVVTVRDVTEVRKMQQQLLAQDRLASIGQLVSGIAHEINNPLTTIIGLSQLMSEQDLPEGLKENINMVYKEAQRTARIVKDLLTFARKHIPVKQTSDINTILENVLRLRGYDEKINNIDIVRELDPNLPQIMVDYYQMQQVFLNIIINAEYFMMEAHKRGTLVIKTEKSGGVLRISITDEGPGIPRKNLSRIFDPFFTTKEVGKGTGLGLSICHGIVTEHGGRIYAESDLGKGATFTIELPVDEPLTEEK